MKIEMRVMHSGASRVTEATSEEVRGNCRAAGAGETGSTSSLVYTALSPFTSSSCL